MRAGQGEPLHGLSCMPPVGAEQESWGRCRLASRTRILVVSTRRVLFHLSAPTHLPPNPPSFPPLCSLVDAVVRKVLACAVANHVKVVGVGAQRVVLPASVHLASLHGAIAFDPDVGPQQGRVHAGVSREQDVPGQETHFGLVLRPSAGREAWESGGCSAGEGRLPRHKATEGGSWNPLLHHAHMSRVHGPRYQGPCKALVPSPTHP